MDNEVQLGKGVDIMRTVLVIGFFFFWLGYSFGEHQDKPQMVSEPCDSKPVRYLDLPNSDEQAFLDKFYSDINEVYFDNKLPKDTKIVVRNIDDPPHTMALMTSLGNGHYVISLDPRKIVTGSQETESLYHEVCYLDLNRRGIMDFDHGKPFQDCMKRLANQDAFERIW